MPRPPKTGDGATGPATSKRPSTKKPNGNGSDGHSSDEVAKRAYEIYQSRGGYDGADFDDWLEAERQLKQPTQSAQTPQSTQPPAPEKRKRPRAQAGS